MRAHPSLLNVPDGPGWECVLRLVQAHLPSFGQEDRSLLLRLIEDWGRGVTWQEPYPEGAEAAAAIAHWLLPDFDDYSSNDERKRTLKVIAKVPNADRERFAALLRGSQNDRTVGRAADDFREIIFEGIEGTPAARDMPELVVSAANDYLLCSEADLQDEWGYASSLELEPLFGIKSGRSHDYFPPSAYRGPFLPLLRHHRHQGLAFIIGVFNHSADWYARPRVREEYVEPPFSLTITFGDGTSRTQWCNARLWNLYRGTSVGPYVLQCPLMALEQWLLEFAEALPRELDAVLLHILQQSDSAALTAVVASVATAFPHVSGETLLVLLRSPICIRIDRQRLANELQAPSKLSGFIPQLDATNRVYEAERKEADARVHRSHDLETAIMNLQLGPLATRVYEILDRHRAELPPLEQQNDDDRIWRLTIHRMDLRQYTVAEGETGPRFAPEVRESPDPGRQYIRLNPKPPEADVKEMMEGRAVQSQALNAVLDLAMWGLKVLRSEQDTTYDPAQWRQRMEEARTAGVANAAGEEHELGRGRPGLVAAACVRDHWDEMSGDERDWCVDVVCSEVEREGDHWNQFARVQRNSMSADRSCAWVLPLLLGKPLDETSRSRVRRAFVVALTHAIDEVRWYAALGIGRHLWAVDRELPLRCVNALATEAMLVQQAADENFRRPYPDRRQIDDIEAEAASFVRDRLFGTDGISDDVHERFDATAWFGAEANMRILTILGNAPTEPVAIAAFSRLAHTLVEWWNADDDRHRNHQGRRREMNHQTESALSDLLQNLLLRTSAAAAIAIVQPIVDAFDRHPRQVTWFLLGLIGVEDREPNTPQFWSLWDLFADRVRRASWLARIDDEHVSGSEMISAIFLGSRWKEDVRHWRSLEGHVHHVHSLFEDLPPSSTVLDDYVRFLYHVGEQSLPEAFIRISKRLQHGSPQDMMRKANTVFLLESLLQRYVYGRPFELKHDGILSDAVLFLIEVLIENGSSGAFRMRDDFVTPVSIT